CDSRDDLAAREPRHHPRAPRAPRAAAGPDGRSPSAALRPPPASNASALPRAAPSVAPVLAGSRRYTPSPWTPQPSMKADISTLLKPDILILRLHQVCQVLTGVSSCITIHHGRKSNLTESNSGGAGGDPVLISRGEARL